MYKEFNWQLQKTLIFSMSKFVFKNALFYIEKKENSAIFRGNHGNHEPKFTSIYQKLRDLSIGVS